ncbi:hypothetical protein HG535_0D05180 [Zygotorulaspora mrakii]|uniref:Dolichyl-diphosphooligosaccharide--protein glycosyltransferase subunit OST6 n=1 Tax=Zygotorulaspora mrakii TaxID=42260 RepID=A0A7H9B4A9_ZYGMR|nr:uncharacterized protein HG535_0D05180 [Zygotorulaspora mrakii]QLG72809.1 hypothetical protein HG535_0D05180 [Zygotorulaspora mrakii]
MKFLRILYLLVLLFAGQSKAVLEAADALQLKDFSGVITVTEDNYEELSRGVPNYFMALFITTSRPVKEGVRCVICDDFEPILRKVAVTISKQAPHAQILFLKADVAFNKLLVKDLKISSIPHMLIFPPPVDDKFQWKSSSFYQYELKEERIRDALHFGDFLAKILKVFIKVDQKFEYQEFFSYFIACIVIFSIFKRVVLPKIPNKPKFFSMLVSLLILLLSITGLKFTQINSVPFIARDPKGNIMYFSGGTGWQFGIEILSVSAMYIVMGVLFCMMLYIHSFSMNDRLRWVLSAVCSCLLFYLCSYYVSCFDIKSPGYPYKF